MTSSRILLPGALPPGSEIERVYEEILRGEQASVTRDAEAAQWTGEARLAADTAIREVEESLPDGWILCRTGGPGGFEVYSDQHRIPVSLSSSLTMAARKMHVDAVIAQINRCARRR